MLALTGRIFRDGDTFVTRCHELEIETYGRTLEEAWRRTLPMIRMHLEVCEQLGRLDSVLERLGAPTPARLSDLQVKADFSMPLYA